MRHSLGQIKAFWQIHGVWPEMGPHDDSVSLQYEGPTPSNLESAACSACEANVWTTLHSPVVAECDTGEICGYCSNDCYFEHRTRNQLEEIVKRSVFILP